MLVDCDAFRLTWLALVWKVVPDVELPGPVTTIVIVAGGGVTPPDPQSLCNTLVVSEGPSMQGMELRYA